jgi:hypothetical protein
MLVVIAEPMLAAPASAPPEQVRAPGRWSKSVAYGREVVFEVSTIAGAVYDVRVSGQGKFDPEMMIGVATWIDNPKDPAAAEAGELTGTGFSEKIRVRGSGRGAGQFILEITERATKLSSGAPSSSTGSAGSTGTPSSTPGVQSIPLGSTLPGSVTPGGKQSYEFRTVPGEEYEIIVQPRAGTRFDVALTLPGGSGVDVAGQEREERYPFVASATSYRFDVAGSGGAQGSYDVTADRRLVLLQPTGRVLSGSVNPGKRRTYQLKTEAGAEYGFEVLTAPDPRFDPVLVFGGVPEDQNGQGKREIVTFSGDGSVATAEVYHRNLAGGRFQVRYFELAKRIPANETFVPSETPVGTSRGFRFATTAGTKYHILVAPNRGIDAAIDIGGNTIDASGPFVNERHSLTGTGGDVEFSVSTRGASGNRGRFRVKIMVGIFGHRVQLGQDVDLSLSPGRVKNFKLATVRSGQYYRVAIRPQGYFQAKLLFEGRPSTNSYGQNTYGASQPIVDFYGNGQDRAFTVQNVGTQSGKYKIEIRQYYPQTSSSSASCGIGFELAFVIPVVAAARRIRHQRRATASG